jgi:hypothetical protein
MIIKVKNNINVECFSGMSSVSIYVEKGREFEDVKFSDDRYGGEDGFYVYEDEYLGSVCFMKDDVEVIVRG